MNFNEFSVSVLHCPFEASSLQLFTNANSFPLSSDTQDTQNSFEEYTQGVQDNTEHAVIGKRGMREMIRHKEEYNLDKDSEEVQISSNTNYTNQKYNPLNTLPIVSCHKRGQLLIWDSYTHNIIGSCVHGDKVNVLQCVCAGPFIYTRVESLNASEEDFSVWVWSAKSFQVMHVLRGHESRIVCLVVHPNNPYVLATAGIDRCVCLWDLQQTTKEPTHRINLDNKANVVSLAMYEMCLLVSTIDVPLMVFDIHTAKPLAAYNNSSTNAVSCMRLWSDMNKCSNVQNANMNSMAITDFTKSLGTQANETNSFSERFNKSGRNKNEGVAGTQRFRVLAGMTDGMISEWEIVSQMHLENEDNVNYEANVNDVEGLQVQGWLEHKNSHSNINNNISSSSNINNNNKRVSILSSSLPLRSDATESKNDIEGTNHHSTRIRLITQCKSHHSSVADVILDTDVLISRSVFDGVCFYHRNSGVGVHFMEHEGCQAWSVDVHNKRVVCGGPRGELYLFEYAAFAALATREVHLTWQSYVHNAVITSVFVTLDSANLWQQVLTCSVNGEVNVFTAPNYVKPLHTLSTAEMPLIEMPLTNTIDHVNANVHANIIACVDHANNAAVYFFDTCTLHKHHHVLPLLLDNGVTALRWCTTTAITTSSSKHHLIQRERAAPSLAAFTPLDTTTVLEPSLLVGTRDGRVSLYNFVERKWHLRKYWSISPFIPFYLSEVLDGMVVVCGDEYLASKMEPNTSSFISLNSSFDRLHGYLEESSDNMNEARDRAIAVIDIAKENLYSEILPLASFKAVIRANLMKCGARWEPSVTPYFVITQEVNGAAQLFRLMPKKVKPTDNTSDYNNNTTKMLESSLIENAIPTILRKMGKLFSAIQLPEHKLNLLHIKHKIEVPKPIQIAAAPVQSSSTRFFYVYSTDSTIVRQVRCSQHGEIEMLEPFAVNVSPLTMLEHANAIYASKIRISNMSLQQLMSAANNVSLNSNSNKNGNITIGNNTSTITNTTTTTTITTTNAALGATALTNTTPLTATTMSLLKNVSSSVAPLQNISVRHGSRSTMGKIESSRFSSNSSGSNINNNSAANLARSLAEEDANKISQVCVVGQCNITIIALRSKSAIVEVYGNDAQENDLSKAKPSHLILHNGTVCWLQELHSSSPYSTSFECSYSELPRDKSASSEIEKSVTPEMAAIEWDETHMVCSLAACCPNERYVALLYSDGLLQLFDTARKEIFARTWILSIKSDPAIEIFPTHECVLIHTRNKRLLSVCVHRRVLISNDVMNDSMLSSVRLAP